MEAATVLLSDLSERRVELWFEGGRLRFRAEKGALTPDLRERIAANKETLLRELRRRASDRVEERPVSRGQKALWYLWQSAPESAAYNVAFTARVLGPVDEAALRTACQALVDRHATLRTTLSEGESGLVQRIHGAAEVDFQLLDMRDEFGSAEELEAVHDAYLRPFDLERGPVFRVRLFQRGESDHILLLAMHHIAADGWSLFLLLEDLKKLYPAEREDKPANLPTPAFQYADYAREQEELIQGPEGEDMWNHWRERLSGAPASLDLPTDRPRPPLQTFNGATFRFEIDATDSQSVRDLARRENATPFMVLLAAWQCLLHRWSRQDRILVGSPTYGRDKTEYTALVGDLINTIVLRADFDGNPSFRSLLAQVRDEALGGIQNQAFPFPELVERLRVPRDPSRGPLFQALFILQKFGQLRELEAVLMPRDSAARVDFGGLTLAPFPMPQQEGQFDLSLEMVEHDGAYLSMLKFNTDLFDVETVASMARHFRNLLRGAARDPESRVSDLDLLDESEREELLRAWNRTEQPVPTNKTLLDYFEEWVARDGNRPALVFDDAVLSYGELNERADILASSLRKMGIAPDDLAGIYFERGVAMVVALLATLKAGGAYLPLDPSFPAERLSFYLEDSGAKFLLTDGKLANDLSPKAARLVILDSEGRLVSDAGETSNLSSPEPDVDRANLSSRLAYVIYTSGSTGKPKGVAIPHSALLNFLLSMRAEPGLKPEDTLLAVTTISFDIAGLELLLPLICGAKIALADRETSLDGAELLKKLDRTKASVMQATPATWRLLLEAGWTRGEGLRAFCGGEALSRELADRILATGAELWNLYGPTETTIWSGLSRVGAGTEAPRIGRPIANTVFHVVDSELRIQPLGVAGELVIGGMGLARGYLNRPELTAEKFTPDPYTAGGRLYRTGDLARRLRNGEIEFLGRLDFQAKLRGFRIELGEIESALESRPDVAQAVALVREDVPGDQRLVAYLKAADERRPADTELRDALRLGLPDYMVPTAFVWMDELPLTPNRKVDRRALPAPELDKRSGERVAPRTETEILVAEVWRELLGLSELGVDENFFEIGGHSLLATRCVSRLRAAFSQKTGRDFSELSLRHLFRFPHVAGLSAELDRLAREDAKSDEPQLRVLKNRSNLPLSHAQERMWFIEEYDPAAMGNNIVVALRLRGPLDRSSVSAAFRAIVQRHDALRTTFHFEDGRPVQRVASDAPVALTIRDLSEFSEADFPNRARSVMREEARRRFPLSDGPLFHFVLLGRGVDDHILVANMHHMISDGWSMGLLFREFAALYEALAIKHTTPDNAELPALPVQYPDYAAWERERLSGQRLDNIMSYWRQTLSGELPRVEWPSDRPRTRAGSAAGHSCRVAIPEDLSGELRRLGGSEGLTSFMTMFGAFEILLHRYTGLDDIIVGSPVANRVRSEIEPLIGLFMNPLPFRVNFGGKPTVREALRRVRERCVDFLNHQEAPFNTLVETLKPVRDLSRPPFYQTLFIFQDFNPGDLNRTGLSHELFLGEEETTILGMDSIWQFWDTGRRIEGLVEFRADMFDRPTAERAFRHFTNLLRAMTENPDARLSELELMDAEERRELLRLSSGPAVAWEREFCVHELFEQIAAEAPDRPAVTDPFSTGESLTYGGLNARANAVARLLRERGAAPETRVGICARRSVDMIAAVLGIMKSGAAFVPIDPDYPGDRRRHILEDSGAGILVAETASMKDFDFWRGQTLLLDDPNTPGELDDADNVNSGVKPANAAYIIYTSGSTGKPKGVVIEHHALSHYAQTASIAFSIQPDDRVLQFASLSFDAAEEEIFTALIRGACLVLRNDEMLVSPKVFLDCCADERVTFLDLPTAYWHVLAQAADSPEFTLPESLRLVVIGGEKARLEALRSWRARVGRQVRLVNTYGPTETTIVATMGDLGEADLSREISIGRPIANSRALILDDSGNLRPMGVAGELCLGGEGLARGYLNREELTRAVFISDPTDPTRRLYRSGDRARLLADGSLQYLGRIDNQVKIRGFRVEPGEIEAVLAACPGVLEAAVVARETDGGPRLAAYASPRAGAALSPGELRRFLAERLPDYMLPADYVVLPDLPRTTGRKIDRRALPVPAAGSRTMDAERLEPRDEIESAIAAVYQKTLGLDWAGADSHFFELGGHSLLATQAVSRLRSVFKIPLPLRDIFENPRVSELASRVRKIRAESLREELPPILRRGVDSKHPLSFAQRRLWFLHKMDPESAAYNTIGAMRLKGALNVAALNKTIRLLGTRHETLRTVFVEEAGEPFQRVLEAPNAVIEKLDFRDRPEPETALREWMRGEGGKPFDLEKGPLARFLLARVLNDEYVFFTVMHHIVSDGWSVGVFVREFGEIYRALVQGESPDLPEPPVQYADFAHWQREEPVGRVLDKQIEYWREKLRDAPDQLGLPTDYPRPARLSPKGAAEFLLMPAELARDIKALALQNDSTLFMVLLTAFKTLLYRHTGQGDILVGSPIANRNHAEIEGLIGCFVNTLVLRDQVDPDQTFLELLARVRETTLDAYSRQDVPFERLVEAVHPRRSLDQTPLFQVMFALQNTPASLLELPDLTIEPVPLDRNVAQFDLTLAVWEGPQGFATLADYRTELFDARTIRGMLRRLQNVLVHVAQNPQRRVGEIPLIDDEERASLTIGRNPAKAFPVEKTIHEWVEEAARRFPDRTAVSRGKESLDYAELNRRANRLAWRLRRMGVGPDKLVGVCMERGLDLIVALLGTLKSGGAYLPIDLAYPADRKAFMLEDASASILLTQSHLLDQMPKGAFQALCVETEFEPLEGENSENPPPLSRPEHAAYVIYTSGSTGKPKGVIIQHDNVVRLFLACQDWYRFDERDVWTFFHSHAFDFSVWEIWGALVFGGRLVVVPYETSRSPEAFCDLLEREKVTVLNQTPSAFRQLIQVDRDRHANSLPDLRLVVFGGEALDIQSLIPWFEKHGDERPQLVNMYGITETTVHVSYRPLTFEDARSSRGSVIGIPIPDLQVYVLDQRLEPVPVGVSGEIHVGGAGLARGYLNRPELTAERFIPNPFPQTPGDRLYKTGDLARILVDGDLEYLGRADDQVKIRGFRIELGEIESHLRDHPAIRHAIVLARGPQVEARLVAYLVPESRPEPGVNELRDFLRRRMPEYMLPSAFVFLDAFPLTSNGKVDRRALPEPAGSRPELEAAYIAPGTDLEKALADIWREELGIEHVGVRDNFFDLGGHSLLVVKIQRRIRELLGSDVPIVTFFQFPTIQVLAANLDASRTDENDRATGRERASLQKEARARRKVKSTNRASEKESGERTT